MNKSYGIVVVSYDNNFYRFFDSIRVKTCLTENIPIVVSYNGTSPPSVLPTWEHYVCKDGMNPTMYNKFLFTCSELLKTEEWQKLDYIIRVNSSTFFNFKKLQTIVNRLPRENCFAGRALGNDCISGLFIVFSKDILKKFIEFGPTTISTLNDDVVFGKVAEILKIPRTLIEEDYIELARLTEVPNLKVLTTALDKTFIRVKNEYKREEIDHYIWHNLYQLYCNKYYV